MSKIPALASEISHVAGLDASHAAPAHAPDPENPVHTHESHADWRHADTHTRWLECVACGVRDYYPGAAQPCGALVPLPGKRAPEPARTLSEALTRLRDDLDAFAAWWRARPSLGEARPSLDEWAAEFLEWRRGPERS